MSERPDNPEERTYFDRFPPLCATHGKPAVLIFPCCGGAKGGQSTSRRKRKRVRENLARARQKKVTP